MPEISTMAKKAVGFPFRTTNITKPVFTLKAFSNSSFVVQSQHPARDVTSFQLKQYHTTLGASFNIDERVLMATSSSGKAQTRVELTNYKEWTSEQVCELLSVPKGKGGASLSKDDVKPLLDTKFNGTSIGNIVQMINDKDKYFAIDRLRANEDYKKVPHTTKEAVVNWVDKLLRRISYNLKTPDSIIAARTDPKFEYLRDLKDNPHKWKELELKIGQNIELPNIGEVESHFVPKDYEHNIPYLLTKQRFDILKKVVTSQTQGFVFSGPFGVSKSYAMLLIASYAIINSIPLLYVPRCGVWVSKYHNGGEAEAEDFLRTLVFYYNYDILSPQTIDKLLTTKEDVVSFLASNLGTTTPIFLLFDEHHELFTNGKVAVTESYFHNYNRWTCTASGTMTIYCGSAHSKFEDNLPASTEFTLINITPPSRPEFQKLLEAFGFKLNEERINRVEYATGRMPREVRLFADFVKGSNDFTDEDVIVFAFERQFVYTTRIERLVNEEKATIQSVLNCIHYLFNLAFSDETVGSVRRLVKPTGSFYDQGIFYKTEDDNLYPTNEAAKRALFSFYANKYDADVLDGIKSVEVGCALKRLIIRNEYKHGKSYGKYHLINSAKPMSSETIFYRIHSMIGMDIKELNDMKCLSRKLWPEQESILFTPEKEKFPAFDYFIVSYISEKKIQLVLKQVTLSTVDAQYNNGDFTELFSPKYLVSKNKIDSTRNNDNVETNDGSITGEYTYSFFELIIHAIMDNYNDCSSVILAKETKKEEIKMEKTTVIERTRCDYRKKKFDYTDKLDLERTITVDGVEISWYFVYESFTSEANQQTKSVKHSNVNYRNREELERDLLLLSRYPLK